MSSNCQAFDTRRMPAAVFRQAAFGHLAPTAASFRLEDDGMHLVALCGRHMSSMACSTSAAGSSNSSSSSNSDNAGKHRARSRLPFASIAGQQLGALPSTSQLRSNNTHKLDKGDEAYLTAAAAAVTATDTFKAGDILDSGKYKLLHKLGTGNMWVSEGIGEGRFTTCWLGKQQATGQEVILKLVEAGDQNSYLCGVREAALHALAGRHRHILSLLDAFEHRSRRGRHAAMVLEKAGTNMEVALALYEIPLQDVDSFGQPVPRGVGPHVNTLRSIARQTLQALDHIHNRGIVHMDLSLDNMLLDKPFQSIYEIQEQALRPPGLFGLYKQMSNWWHIEQAKRGNESSKQQLFKQIEAAQQGLYHEGNLHEASIKLTDFGRAVPYKRLLTNPQAGRASDQLAADPLAHEYNRDGEIVFGNPALRPPEEVLGLNYRQPAYDIWRLGCVMFRLSAGRHLFDLDKWRDWQEKHPRVMRYDYDHFHLLDMVDTLGHVNREVARQSPAHSKYFLPNDWLKVSNAVGLSPGELSVQRQLFACWKRAGHYSHTDEQLQEEASKLDDFITSMLVYDPSKRPSAAKLLQHKWLQEEQEPQSTKAAAQQ